MITPRPTVLRPLNAASGDHHLARRLADGELLRLYPGQYIDAARWAAASVVERYDLQLRALSAHTHPVFCCASALWLHGIPTFGTPTVITTVARGGRHGLQRSHLAVAGDADPGAYYVRHVRHRHPDPDVSVMGGATLVSAAQATAAVLKEADLRTALTVSDAVARRGGTARQAVEDEVRGQGHVRVQDRALRRLEAGRAGAGSPAESASRAIILEAGFPEPVLQEPFYDRFGKIGEVDAWWAPWRLIGEMDGEGKYVDPDMTRGRSPLEVLRAEKDRENRLLATGAQLRRWGWAELVHPERLVRLLSGAGLPRSRTPLLT